MRVAFAGRLCPPVGGQQFPGPLRDFEAVQELGLHDPDKRTHQAISCRLGPMLWGIDRDAWISVWAGALGAIPAAVISAGVAAWVAVTVLNRSNMHQQRLAQDQLAEQRAEAARERERAALAEVIFAAESLFLAANDSAERIRELIPVLQSAMARWRIEEGHAPMQSELMGWSSLLVDAADGRLNAKASGSPEEEEAARERLTDVAAEIVVVALIWPDSDAAERQKLRERMNKARRTFRPSDPEFSDTRS